MWDYKMWITFYNVICGNVKSSICQNKYYTFWLYNCDLWKCENVRVLQIFLSVLWEQRMKISIAEMWKKYAKTSYHGSPLPFPTIRKKQFLWRRKNCFCWQGNLESRMKNLTPLTSIPWVSEVRVLYIYVPGQFRSNPNLESRKLNLSPITSMAWVSEAWVLYVPGPI